MPLSNFSAKDKELLFYLIKELTGSDGKEQVKLDSALTNVQRRMEITKTKSFGEYLTEVENSLTELAHFISSVTIHTTRWFREKPHFNKLQSLAIEKAKAFADGKMPFRVLSAGCSSGEEVYSMGLVLQDIKNRYPKFNYQIEGWDLDPLSLEKASNAVYPLDGRADIPREFQHMLLIGSEKSQGYFTVDKEIRSRTSFRLQSILKKADLLEPSFDLIFCRNVLIYFNLERVEEIVRNLSARLAPSGLICLGHCETVEATKFNLTSLGNSTYKREPSSLVAQLPKKRSNTEQKRLSLVLIGASTGGTEVLVKLLQALPRPCPPVFVVQHIALSFARPFAERLAKVSGLELATPTAGALLKKNTLYMALDDYHIGVAYRGGNYFFEVSHAPAMHGVRPSVDFLFLSAKNACSHAPVLGILLTGMGKDGAKGLLELRNNNATTIVQDAESSAVFGMPQEAIAIGAAQFVDNPEIIRQRLIKAIRDGF